MNTLIIIIGSILAIPRISDGKIIKRLLDITSSPLYEMFNIEQEIHQKYESTTEKLKQNHSSKKLELMLLDILQTISHENLLARKESCTAESLKKILNCLAMLYPSVIYSAKINKETKFKRSNKRDDYDEDIEDWVEKLEETEAKETTPDAIIDKPAHATCLVESIADYMLCAIAEASEASSINSRTLHTEMENDAASVEYFKVFNKLNEQF